jgi:hypothetical protein
VALFGLLGCVEADLFIKGGSFEGEKGERAMRIAGGSFGVFGVRGRKWSVGRGERHCGFLSRKR